MESGNAGVVTQITGQNRGCNGKISLDHLEIAPINISSQNDFSN